MRTEELKTFGRRYKRWPLVIFYRILDIAGINSQVIFVSNDLETQLEWRLFLRGLRLNLLKLQIPKKIRIPNISRTIRLNKQLNMQVSQ